MTRRRRSAPSPPPIDESAYTALRAFCRGYLHEDALVEHGSAAAAAAQGLADADSAERAALRADWLRLFGARQRPPLGHAKRALAALGAAWQPRTRADLDALARVFQPGRGRT